MQLAGQGPPVEFGHIGGGAGPHPTARPTRQSACLNSSARSHFSQVKVSSSRPK